jgi:hypothetical protein
VVLLEEQRHVDDQVTYHRQAWQRLENNLAFECVQVGQAGQAVLAVDVHRVRSTHPFATGAAE